MPDLIAPAAGLVLPEQLAQQAADAVRELLAEAAAANTTRSYAAALRYWAGWHQARFGVELTLPVTEAAVIQFLVDHIQRKNKIWPGQRAAAGGRSGAGRGRPQGQALDRSSSPR